MNDEPGDRVGIALGQKHLAQEPPVLRLCLVLRTAGGSEWWTHGIKSPFELVIGLPKFSDGW